MTLALVKPGATVIPNPAMNLGSDCGYGQVMSDIFHDLSQPLSTLTCLLEINLLLSRTVKQWRHDLKIALKQIHSIVSYIRALRELWEAGNQQQDQQVLSLVAGLREAVADLLPVAESARVTLFLTTSSDCLVKFQASRLRQALVHLLEFSLESSAPDAEVKITADEKDATGRIRIVLSAVALSEINESGPTPEAGAKSPQSERKGREMKRRVALAVAGRIFESAGGSLQTERGGEGLWLEMRLPLVPVPQ